MQTKDFQHFNVVDLFESKDVVKVCAPMVRYSKLQFRNLVKEYGCDLCFTPMILADSFCQSSAARNNEFTTNQFDYPLITQFAANTEHDFVGAAHMVAPFCNGVDLNCGCPQRWAKQQGLGCIMLENPQLIYDLVRQCRNQISKPFSVSVKMRILKDLEKTVEICRQLENCGVNFLTIHGRTSSQTTGEINKNALKLISENLQIPIIGNGGIKNLAECHQLAASTGCKGVMIANGLLTNPTLFTGTHITPVACIKKWLDICYNSTLRPNEENNKSVEIAEKPANLTFQCFHHHLVFMLEKILSRAEKRIFNNLQSFRAVFQFIETKFELKASVFDSNRFDERLVLDLDYSDRARIYNSLKPIDHTAARTDYFHSSDGKFFESRKNDEVCCDWADIFTEKG